MNTKLQELIEEGLTIVRSDRVHYLKPSFRITLCEVLGETSMIPEKKSHKSILVNSSSELTFGDHARCWSSILAARKVLPIWRKVLLSYELLQNALIVENVSLSEQMRTNEVKTAELPRYLLELAEGVLSNKFNISFVIDEVSIAELMIGNYRGYEQEEYPGEAHDVEIASLQAAGETCGYNYYTSNDKNKTFEFPIFGKDAPGGASFRAYSAIYEENIWTGKFDTDLSLEFWEWWLMEAIPQAWELAHSTYRSQS
jgi:hypothetical protein